MRYREILEACWTGYKQAGMKKKGDRMVPNCVPVSEEHMEEDLKKWFKEKWVRFGPDGKIRGDCARGSGSEGKPKCLPQAKAHALGKKGRASAAAKKRREDPDPERRGAAKNVATKVNEFAPSADRDDNDEVPNQLLNLANRWWNATDDQPKITNVLRSLGWSIAQVESEDDAIQLMHTDGTTYFISADDFDPDVFEQDLDEACWKGYHKEGNKKMFGKTYPDCVKNTKEDIDEAGRIARKAGQPANSKKHSDLYTDENPQGTITGLKFATVEDARASVSKIRSSGRSHAHKVQAAVAMEQRARAAGKASAAAVYRAYINSVKKTDESLETYVDQGVCPICHGNMVAETQLTEKQDACYHKVKSRYKVWPSAYASGALVQCRKKGAANWGNKGK